MSKIQILRIVLLIAQVVVVGVCLSLVDDKGSGVASGSGADRPDDKYSLLCKSISESTAVLSSELYSCKYMLDNVFWPVR